jgi:uncharacterized OB-fold protein
MSPATTQAPWIHELTSFVGKRGGPVFAWDPVNAPMVRQWCEVFDFDFAPFVDADAAAAGVHGGLVAPATMLPVWLMPGLRNARPPGSDTTDPRAIMKVLEREGYVGILGTDTEQTYERPLRPGERLSCIHSVDAVSDEKLTRMGPGFFVTFLQEFFDEAQQAVGTVRLRILRFKPQAAPAAEPKRPPPPQPAINQDTAFFWEGLQAGQLLIQRCAACGTLRHPPGPACTQCHSLDWDTVPSTGRGKLFSFVVMHHPKHPGFDYPLPVGLVELDEGVRLVAPLTGLDSAHWRTGMRVQAVIQPVAGEHRLPLFRPSASA